MSLKEKIINKSFYLKDNDETHQQEEKTQKTFQIQRA